LLYQLSYITILQQLSISRFLPSRQSGVPERIRNSLRLLQDGRKSKTIFQFLMEKPNISYQIICTPSKLLVVLER